MNPKAQIRKVELLLQRGCTMMELIHSCKTTTPSRRVRDLRDKGWLITKHKVEGKNYHWFLGTPPKKTEFVPKTAWRDIPIETEEKSVKNER